ncbi:MSMEG_1061 family FMN-dependent PPOX-type flavoprotein [Thalassococcus lentus]|uniref:Pyridoxamine 5'-phosphate oxidase family protein n=1 Tax=Thalassococcus lentus TaxID=1210524 RepID=A0ABT4XMK2_9RHOB|nr:MSMEG_1061 family FMN-dependent PPOX-type flavoprotein [Thalassococcus lentus]MDA7423171.1 pyridoxamine 5'-phosphate oxidase family protein [Thalassococcus lentus]
MSYVPNDIVTSIDEVRDVLPGIQAPQTAKVIDHVDALIEAWIARSPYMVMSTVDSSGRLDTSPKGDPAGFVKVLDQHTLVIPDRPGNHRFDSFQNILETGRVGLMFLVPNRTEVVRVTGRAVLTRDMKLREMMAIKSRVPDFAIVVSVEEACYHCGKAAIRSGLWAPDRAAPTDGLPTYAQALEAHANLGIPIEDIQERLTHNDANRLYDE